ncbi:MAG: RNA-directed DNA polymerase, partial [Polaribacter sp.]
MVGTWSRPEHLTKGGVMTHLNNSTTPSGDYFVQRADMQPAFNNNLFDEVLAAPNLKRAWKQVRANKGAAGVDGLQIGDFLTWSRLHWK